MADSSGAVLPGVSILLESAAGTRATVSDGAGAFRFLGLDRGLYTLTLGLAGFTSLAREVRIVTGENVELALTLEVSEIEEVVRVSAETPLVDTKKRGTATTTTAEELASIPTARDPWAVLRNVPGVLTDRVNIAGNESGQQVAIVGKGTDGYDRVWSLDFVVMTEMATFGGSPSYFDFGAFDEINVATGGPDLKIATGGVGMLLPGLDYPGDPGDLITWSEVRLRVALSLALDAARRTVLRASYAEYAQQLQVWEVLGENPMLGSYLAYAWHDLNGDRLPQPSEVLLDQFLYSYNVDPSRPGEVAEPVSFIDRDLQPKRDSEMVLGIDRELAPNLAVTLSAELFNVFNSGVVLLRDGNARAESFDRIDEILSPRILRLGARLTF